MLSGALDDLLRMMIHRPLREELREFGMCFFGGAVLGLEPPNPALIPTLVHASYCPAIEVIPRPESAREASLGTQVGLRPAV